MIARAFGGAKAHGRILIASLTLGSLATAAAAWWYYTRQLAAMEEEVIHELRAVSDNKTKQIANWRSERLGDGHVLMSSPLARIGDRILAGEGTASDTATMSEVTKRFEEAFLYTGAALCDFEGHARFTSGNIASDPSRLRDLARETIGALDSQLSDLRLDPQSGRPLMALVLPVGQKGALILDIDPERFLYPYLLAWSGHSESAETLLMRRNGEYADYLSELRYHPGAPLRLRRSLKGANLPPDSALEAGTVFRSVDYRGAPVISILRHISGTPWYVTVKIDDAEADAPEHRLGWEMAVITGLIALVNVTGAAVVWRGRSVRLQGERLERFRAVANDTPAYLWMADPRMENTFLNAPLAKFLGTTHTHLREAWSDTIHPEDAEQARAKFREGMDRQAGYTHEYRVRRYDGEYRRIVSKAAPRFSADGVFLGLAGSMLDVTGRRLAERKLREANERLQDLSSRLIGAQEEERKRLARELHDDLSQQIAALSIATSNLKRQIPEERAEARTQADSIHHKLVQLAEAIRRMSHELHPAVLQYSGLAPAMRSYCEEFGALTGLKIALEIEGSFEGVAPAAALCLFRVAQEALRNVAKHARVSAASVELRRGDGVLRLTVSDGGVGMEAGSAGAKAGLGLLSIQERARLVGGKVEIRSRPGEGTSVTVEIAE
jgi:two-component system sensor histidine kinase UhpB